MPQRFLRPGITTSKRWNRCDWPTQSLYLRIVTLVDDYGRYEADAELLRSHAFPFGDPAGKVMPLTTIVRMLRALVSSGLMILYDFEGKEYLQLLRWHERTRSPSRYPEPTCEQMTANDSKCLPPSPSPASIVPAPANIDQTTKRLTAKPSGLAEVIEFCEEEGLTESDAKYFFHTKEGNGWRNGKEPVRDWKATVRAWREAGHLPSTKGNGSAGQLSHKDREKKINSLNERKRDLLRQYGDFARENPEFMEVEKQLRDL